MLGADQFALASFFGVCEPTNGFVYILGVASNLQFGSLYTHTHFAVLSQFATLVCRLSTNFEPR